MTSTVLTPPVGVTDSNFPAYKLDTLFANLILLSSILFTMYLPSVKRNDFIVSIVIIEPSGCSNSSVVYSGV